MRNVDALTALLSPTMVVDRSFGRSSLPSTMALASRFRADIEKKLESIVPDWPFEDRVLVWMLPNMQDETSAYHRNEGAPMKALFAAHQLDHIDEILTLELLRRLDA